MALIEVLLPKMGESVMEATINTWLKKEGDTVEEEEPLLEVSTDKVDTEVPSAHTGIIKEIIAQEGEVVQVGSPIAIISTDGEGMEKGMDEVKKDKAAEPIVQTEKKVSKNIEVEASFKNGKYSNGEDTATKRSSSSDRFYSPLVKNIAKQENISREELDRIEGTGKDNRVTKKDILNFLKERKGERTGDILVKNSDQKPVLTAPREEIKLSEGDEIIEMDRMRKIIAERMIESRRTSAHVQSFIEADVTPIVKWRDRVKEHFEKSTGEKLTYTPIFLEAIVNAIKEFPMINISVKGDKIIKHKHINVGMAAALPNGNLIVPVIKNADQLSLVGLAAKVNDLADRARRSALQPDELAGGTYTVTNVGVFGSTMGTPIILQPQVAIMALGAIIKKPAVIETADGDMIGIRHKMFLSHSYDHRVIDGMLGSMFAKKVKDNLENFDTERKY